MKEKSKGVKSIVIFLNIQPVRTRQQVAEKAPLKSLSIVTVVLNSDTKKSIGRLLASIKTTS
jgi:hypothetical protein